jgi:outer membrane biosynthesis protein TonB
MKRCPQCEFIYEDDQSLCDMDGVLLVLDSRTLPNVHALTTVPAKVQQQRRNRAVPAFATLILALVLGMVYYVSTRRNAVPTTYTPASATSTSNPAPVSNPTPEAQPSESTQPQPVEAKPAPARPVKKVAAKTVSVSQPKPTPAPKPEPKKEESKVGSILKKTGRILKKPFKF